MKYLLSLFGIFLFFVPSISQELPIKVGRTLSFTTDQGSYMNVDVSPDGKTLLFDLLGDLFSVPVEGGNATQLTRGIALNLRPVWSPNGRRIAYVSDKSGDFHLNVMDRAGSLRMVIGESDEPIDYGSDALWTADGLFISIAGSIYSLIGGKIPNGINFRHVVRFSPDGKVAYGIDSNKLHIYDLNSGRNKIIASGLNEFQSAALSPDARWWCYITDSNSRKSLIAENLISGVSHILVSSLVVKDPRYNPAIPSPHFSFSPDSKNIFIGYGGKIHRIAVQSGNDTVIKFVAKVNADLGAFNYNTFRVSHNSLNVKYTRSANASPDGKSLLFATLDKIFLMNLKDGKVKPLAIQEFSQFQPTYSPDGQWVAYVTWSDTAGGFLWRVPAVGGNPEQLTHIAGQYQRPTWYPDGSLIAIIKGAAKLGDRDDQGIGQLELVPINGSQVRIIDDSVPLWNQISFSKTGDRIIYTPKFRRGQASILKPQLVSKELNGKDLQVVAIGSDLTFYDQKTISPDGRFIVYSADEDLYLVPNNQMAKPSVISDDTEQIPVIKFASGVDPCWEKQGQVLGWTYGNRYYRVGVEKIIDAAENSYKLKIEGNVPENKYVTALVKPDEVISLKLSVPRFYAHGIVALKHVRIITMRKNAVIENGTVIIKNGRFAAIGPATKISIPKEAKLFDLRGKTIIPGIIDLHLHMRVPPNIFPQQSWMYLVNLAFGVTTARDPSSNFDAFGYGELLASGQMIGPRLYTVGRPVRFSDGVIRLDKWEDLQAVVRKRLELGGIVVKDYLSTQPRIKRQWLLLACRGAGLNLTNEGWFDPILQLGMIKDGCTGVEHNPMWGDVYKDVINFYGKSSVYFTPTIQISSGRQIGSGKEYFKYRYWHTLNEKLQRFTFSDPKMGSRINAAESWEAILKSAPKDSLNPEFLTPAAIDWEIYKTGGHVALGSHGEAEGIGTHDELWALTMGGFSNMEALQAATITGAKALGVQRDLGSIEVGKIADLVILNKNPLDDIHNSREILYVMKDGVLYEGNTLNEVWPVTKKCPEWKFKGDPSAN